MKTSILSLLSAGLLLAGCGQKGVKSDKLVIATSFYPMYLATANIADGVPGVQVVNITRPTTGCLHDYQLSPEELKNLSQASIFVVNGAGMESFFQKAVDQMPNLKIIEASAGVPLVKGDGETGDNPHVWVSVSGAMQQVNNIAAGLIKHDPEHAPQYRANADKYLARLDSLRVKMLRELKPAAGRDIITFHEAFPYFAQEFGLKIAAVIEREPGSEPSAAELAQTIKLVRQKKIKALFAEPQYPAKAAQSIARETGAKVFILDPVSTGPMEDLDYYITAMEKNLEVLREALR
jgi:zinc transport system substrate-binding protein